MNEQTMPGFNGKTTSDGTCAGEIRACCNEGVTLCSTLEQKIANCGVDCTAELTQLRQLCGNIGYFCGQIPATVSAVG